MKKLTILTASAFTYLTPQAVLAVTYTSDGEVLLGTEPVTQTNNLLAAAGLGQFNLTCLLLLSLMLASLYLLHIVWHPKRDHDSLNETARHTGSVRFYLGGMVVWMLISIMAQTWCLLLPLTLIFAGTLVYYVVQKSELVQSS